MDTIDPQSRISDETSTIAEYHAKLVADLAGEEYGPDDLPRFETMLVSDAASYTVQRRFFETSVRLWAERFIPSEDGMRLQFADRPWMTALWDDKCPMIACQKPTQVGASTWAYCLAFHRAVLHGRTVIFTMPTSSGAANFVSGRLDPVVDSSPLLAGLLNRNGRQSTRSNPRDNTKVKHVGAGVIYFRGCMTKRDAVQVPAHVLIHDEIDLSSPETIEMYEHRLDNLAPHLWQIYTLSTPTAPGYGINRRYEDSCQYEWLVRCEACNWRGPLDYWTHTQGHLEVLTCECGQSLNPMNGVWVALHPDLIGIRHGYKLSRLMYALPNERGAEQLRKLHERRQKHRFTRHFYNMDLGETSSEGVTSIPRDRLLQTAFTVAYPYPAEGMRVAEMGAGPYIMGVDQGDTLTITVGRADLRRDEGRIRIVLPIRAQDPDRAMAAWDYAARLMVDYKVEMCVVDGMPDIAAAHALAKQFPGRVLVCYYKEGQRTQIALPAAVNQNMEDRATNPYQGYREVGSTTRVDISVERNEALDITANDLLGGTFMLPSPPDHPEIQELFSQLENNIRRPVEDKHGNVVYRWERTGGNNDYFHSINYMRLAYEQIKLYRKAGINPASGGPVVIFGVKGPGQSGAGSRPNLNSPRRRR